MSRKETWAVSMRQKVLSEVHKHAEILPQDYKLQAADPKVLPRGVFHPRPSKTSLPMTGLASTSDPTWPTGKPENLVQQAADCALLKWAFEEKAFATGAQ
eukprot:10227810-Lingulodinium_polyedra.AAC.1